MKCQQRADVGRGYRIGVRSTDRGSLALISMEIKHLGRIRREWEWDGRAGGVESVSLRVFKEKNSSG